MSLMSETAVRALTLPADIAAMAKDSKSFKPLTHGRVLELLDESLVRNGLEVARNDDGVSDRRFTLIKNNAKMYGTMRLTSKIDDTSALMLGVANSWNKSLSLRIGFGSHVFVCTNGCFFAEKVVGRKHTTNIETSLPALIDSCLAQSKTYLESQTKFFARLREVTLTDIEVHDFVVKSALDYDVITTGEIASVVEEWRKPRYEEFAARNAWSLQNAYTETAKRIQAKNGNLHASRMVRLSGLLAKTFGNGLAVDTDEPDTDVIG